MFHNNQNYKNSYIPIFFMVISFNRVYMAFPPFIYFFNIRFIPFQVSRQKQMYRVIHKSYNSILSKFNKDVLYPLLAKADKTFLIFCETFVQIIIAKFVCIPVYQVLL